jgi:signal transduction histidine kinase
MLGMNKSIFRRLILSYMFTILMGIGIVGIIISYLTNGYIYNAKQDELLRKSKIVNLALQDTPTLIERDQQVLEFMDQSFDARIWVFDRKGEIIATSTKDEVSIGKSVATSIVDKVLQGENAVNKLKFEGLSEPMLSVVVPWGKEDHVYGGVVLHAPVTGIEKIVGKIRETILWATLFGISLSTAMVSYLSWSISRPLQKIDRAASKIGMGNYDERIDIVSEDEIGDLANTMNTMAEKMEKVDLERQKLDQLRNDFLANVSHELRTPLTTMQGFLEALQDGLIEKEGTQKYYDVMYQETMHMNLLIDDLMDLIKLEHKEIELNKHAVDVQALLRKGKFKFEQRALEKKVDMDIHIEDQLPKAYADSDRLEQIINNIIKNAVKFTDDGRIDISAWQEESYILFTITDTGIGISKADQELIWERFFKVDRGRAKQNKGTGLGLAIVKELVELHQGKIAVSSELGKGTEVKVWIPIVQM